MEKTSVSKEQSKIKMVALTIHGFDNVTWYSYIRQNKKRSELIIEGMLRRFVSDKSFCVTRIIQFYENNILIKKIRIR